MFLFFRQKKANDGMVLEFQKCRESLLMLLYLLCVMFTRCFRC